jgi:hypothetical protein
MGKRNWEWQDTGYVLRLFGARLRAARRSYERFVAEGVGQGRKPELVGGGLIRSAGGWSAIKALRGSGMRIMGDERILGDADFVESVLKQAQERYEKKTLARVKGLRLETLIERVVEELGLIPSDVCGAGRKKAFAWARAVICAIAIEYMGVSGREVARGLNVSDSAVSKLAQRARNDALTEQIARRLFQ